MSNTVIVLILVVLLAGCAKALPMSGDAKRGAKLFTQGQSDAPPCSTCHHKITGQCGFSVGPNLAGIVERASRRVEGMTATDYMRQSILEPRRFVVPGYRNMMYSDYNSHLTEQDVLDLIAYLLTL
jgi:cytochrome c2